MHIGTDVVAEVESSLLGTTTIRHQDCALLLPPGQDRCDKCKSHRKSLHVMLGRSRRSTRTEIAISHTNYRYLTTLARTRRMSNLHKKYVLEKRKVERLKKRVNEMREADGMDVTTETNEDLKAILKDNYTRIAEKYPSNSFHRIFWNQHSQAASCKNARGVRWHPAMIRWCLYLRHLSGKAYETLRGTGVLQLPSQRMLRDYTHYIPSTTGFSSKVDKVLQDTLKVRLDNTAFYVQM